LDLQLSIILAEIANSVHPSISSSAFLLREYFTVFLANGTTAPEGTTQAVIDECFSNLSHFAIDSSEFTPQESDGSPSSKPSLENSRI
jgi:hypothetical protein